MTSAIQFLNDQISSDQVWKDHKRAMECAQLEDKIKVGLSLFGLFSSSDDLWSRRVQAGVVKFDPEFAATIHRAYKWWLEPCPSILEAVCEFEKEGYRVAGAEDLRDAHHRVRQILHTNVIEVSANLRKARAIA